MRNWCYGGGSAEAVFGVGAECRVERGGDALGCCDSGSRWWRR